VKYIKYSFLTVFVFISSFSIFFDSNTGFLFNSKAASEDVVVIGTGYVGLIVGSSLANVGHSVTCVDIDEDKIEKLKEGVMPIYEPGLKDIVYRNHLAKRLSFATDVLSAIKKSKVIMIAVGTPMGENGKANLKALHSVAKNIGDVLKDSQDYKIVCIKSTVPVGTNKKIKSLIREYAGENANFDIVSNPEFLRAGAALKDLHERNPIVLGSDSERALSIMADLYRPIVGEGTPLIKTNLPSAEMIKYAWNCLVAVKVSYVNDLSRFCNACGADILQVIKAMGFEDIVLPFKNVRPGPGLGGSCLPKDTRALVAMADKQGVDLAMVKAAIRSSHLQKEAAIEQLYDLLDGNVRGKTIGILGLSFKANTDDIRKSPAIPLIRRLLADGATIKAYDPQAVENMKMLFPEITYYGSKGQVISDSDALVILTAWEQFKNLDLKRVAKTMKQPVLVDARNMFDPGELYRNGFRFANFGRA